MSATQCGNERVSAKAAESEANGAERSANEGRDERGRFAAGNCGGPGNPFARRVAEFRKVLHECADIEDMRYIGKQLVALAKMGDLAAIKLLLQYQVGKPAATVDPDTLDLEEIALFQRGPTGEELDTLLKGKRIQPGAWLTMLRFLLPLMVQQYHEVFVDMFRRLDEAQAAGEPVDSQDIVDDAIDEVLGRTPLDEEMEQPLSEPMMEVEPSQEPSVSSNGESGVDSRQTMTSPLPNGHFRERHTGPKVSENGDNEGPHAVPPRLERCPLCRK